MGPSISPNTRREFAGALRRIGRSRDATLPAYLAAELHDQGCRVLPAPAGLASRTARQPDGPSAIAPAAKPRAVRRAG